MEIVEFLPREYDLTPEPPRVLVSIQYYLPGFKGGGTIRSLSNLVDQLGREFSFRILTGDRDLRETVPYPSVQAGEWLHVGNARVRYMRPREWWPATLARTIRHTPHDIIYLSSCFMPRASIGVLALRRLRAIPRKPIILAPRGEFSMGAMQIKRWKKRSFLWIAKRLGLFKDVVWQASTDIEERDIHREIGQDAPVVTARDCSPDYSKWSGPARPAKAIGEARICFVSRIAPKKNLLYAIGLLCKLRGHIKFDVMGPIDGDDYWRECCEAIRKLPSNVVVRYKGSVRYNEMPAVLSAYDLFVFPTRGENFGHSILEALAAGCPVLISDETPWRGLTDAGVGWDLPLKDETRFSAAVQTIIDMSEEEHHAMRRRAKLYATDHAESDVAVDQNRAMFRRVCFRKLGTA